MEQLAIMLAIHIFAIVEHSVILVVKTVRYLKHQQQIQVGISFSFFYNLNTIFFLKVCPLNCSPGYCVATGDRRNPYACMCEGVLTSSKCKSG